MKVKFDKYGKFDEIITCTAKTDDGKCGFYWKPDTGLNQEADLYNNNVVLSYDERIEAARKAKIMHRIIYGLNQKI